MHLYLFVLLISVTTTMCNVILKKFQRKKTLDFPNFLLLNFINALTASIFFFVVSGFKININTISFLFSLVHSLVVVLVLMFNLCAMSRISLVVVGIIVTSGNILGTSFLSVLIFNEEISLRLSIAIILILLATVVPFISDRNKSDNKLRIGKSTILFSILLFVVSSLEVVILKLYVINKWACDTYSYFFMLNFILVVVCVFVMPVYFSKRKYGLKKTVRDFSFKYMMYIVSRTLISNVGAILTTIVLAQMNASLYSTLTASTVLVGNAIASGLFFKENIPWSSRISVVLAIVAVILAN